MRVREAGPHAESKDPYTLLGRKAAIRFLTAHKKSQPLSVVRSVQWPISNLLARWSTLGPHSIQTQTGGAMKLNTTRVWLGGIAGGGGWSAWGFFVGMRLSPLYEAMRKQGLFLQQPRYALFTPLWIVLIFVMSILIAHLYAWARATAGAGPKTAVKIGMIVGFCAGVPGNFAQAAWAPVPRMLPLGWMLDLWIGSILAALVAGFLYKE